MSETSVRQNVAILHSKDGWWFFQFQSDGYAIQVHEVEGEETSALGTHEVVATRTLPVMEARDLCHRALSKNAQIRFYDWNAPLEWIYMPMSDGRGIAAFVDGAIRGWRGNKKQMTWGVLAPKGADAIAPNAHPILWANTTALPIVGSETLFYPVSKEDQFKKAIELDGKALDAEKACETVAGADASEAKVRWGKARKEADAAAPHFKFYTSASLRALKKFMQVEKGAGSKLTFLLDAETGDLHILAPYGKMTIFPSQYAKWTNPSYAWRDTSMRMAHVLSIAQNKDRFCVTSEVADGYFYGARPLNVVWKNRVYSSGPSRESANKIDSNQPVRGIKRIVAVPTPDDARYSKGSQSVWAFNVISVCGAVQEPYLRRDITGLVYAVMLQDAGEIAINSYWSDRIRDGIEGDGGSVRSLLNEIAREAHVEFIEYHVYPGYIYAETDRIPSLDFVSPNIRILPKGYLMIP